MGKSQICEIIGQFARITSVKWNFKVEFLYQKCLADNVVCVHVHIYIYILKVKFTDLHKNSSRLKTGIKLKRTGIKLIFEIITSFSGSRSKSMHVETL